MPPPLPAPKRKGHPAQSPHPNLDGHLFDFLRRKSDGEIYRILNSEDSVHSAVALRFLPLDQRARLLRSLAPKDCVEIETMGARLDQMPSSEFIRIADSLQRKMYPVAAGPDATPVNPSEDQEFWSEALDKSNVKQALLLALEQTRPDLKKVLDRFQIKFDDIPSLPRQRIGAVLSALTDKELSLALSACPRPIVETLIGELPPNRKERVISRMRVQGSMPKSITEPAVKTLMRRFHERTL